MADQQLNALVTQMKLDLSDYQQKLDQMQQQTSAASRKVSSAFDGVNSVITKLGASFGAFATGAINSAMNWGSAVDKLSHQTGMAAEETSKWLVIMKRAGVDTDTAGMMFARFSMRINQSTKEMQAAAAEGKTSGDVLSRLGISALTTEGHMKSTGEIFAEVKDKIAGMSDGWQKSAIEMELFGRSGVQLNGVLSMSSEEMQKAIDKAQALGLVIDGQTAASWKKFKREMEDAKSTMTAIGIQVGNEMLPKLREMLTSIQDLTKWYVNLSGGQKDVVNGLVSLVAQLALARAGIAGIEWVIGQSLPGWAKWVYYIGLATFKLIELQNELTNTMDVSYDLEGRPIFMPKKKSVSDFKQDEERSRKATEPPPDKPPPTNDDPYLGGGASSSDTKTALDTWIESYSELLKIKKDELDLNKINREEYDKFLADQLIALEQVSAGQDEVNKKKLQQLSIEKEQKASADEAKKAVEAAADYFMKQAQDQGEQIRKDMEEKAKLYEQDYNDELRLRRLSAANKTELLNSMYQEDAEYYAKRDKLSGDEQLKEATRAAIRKQREHDLTQSILEDQLEAARRNQQAWDSNMADLITGTRSAQDILKQQWREFVEYVLAQMFRINAESNIFSAVLGGAFGLAPMSSVGHRASGGPVGAGQPYVVGEVGKELFVPDTSGYIVPNNQLNQLMGSGAGGSVVVNVTLAPSFPSLDPASGLQMFKSWLPQCQSEINSAVINGIRTSSPLNRAIGGVR